MNRAELHNREHPSIAVFGAGIGTATSAHRGDGFGAGRAIVLEQVTVGGAPMVT